MRKFPCVLILLLLVGEFASAQSFFNNRYNRRLLVSGGAGTSSYFGDLNNPRDFFDPTLNVSGGLMYMVNPQIGIRAEFQYVRLKGSDAQADMPTTQWRNLSFRSNNQELNVMGVYHILPQGTRYYQRPVVNPYVVGGLGLLWYSPRAEYQGKTYALRQFQTEGVRYSPVTLVIPMGGGVKFRVNPYFNVSLEVAWRKTFTDYLDDVSNRYTDPATIEDPIGQALADRSAEAGYEPRAPGSRRGNPEKDDAYAVFAIKAEYFIPPELFNLDDLFNRTPGQRPRRSGVRLRR